MEKTNINKFRTWFRAIKKMLSNFKTLAMHHGQWKSILTNMPINANGMELPWYTYPAIEYLNSFTLTSFDVFEFGSGNSSIYWAKRAKKIISVEHNKEWFATISQKKMSNQEIILAIDENSYAHTLSAQNKLFDIIIIDGAWRMECTQEAIKYIKPEGMIILDNSDRIIERKCSEALRENGFIQIDFSGFGPINNYCWTTSIFIKTGCHLQKLFQGPSPIRGLKN